MDKIIYVVDKKSSALHTAALSRVSLSGGKIFISNEYISPRHLLNDIYKEGGGIVVFSWRKVLSDIISLDSSSRMYKKFDDKFTFTFLIADHLGLESDFKNFESKIMGACEYYVVTSKLLFDQYSAKYPEKPPRAVYHDLPNLKLIEFIRRTVPRQINSKIQLIWVGNSKWGTRQGRTDHKRFEQYIKPFKKFLNEFNCCDLEIIDSADNYSSPCTVMKKIRNADILLQVSRSEGTGLPTLEAIGLGTKIVSTNVGIIGEIFDSSNSAIVDVLSFSEMHEKVHKVANSNDQSGFQIAYEDFITKVGKEMLFHSTGRIIPESADSWTFKAHIRLFWLYRYLSNLNSEVLSLFTRSKSPSFYSF